jgi:hypothetical protein
LAADVGLDLVQLSDSLQRLGGNRGFGRLVQVIEGAPGVRPTGSLEDSALLV